MAEKRTRMRKQPSQERAQVSVDAILIAAKRVIENVGLGKLTTSRVADVAGVSVGTLYQYFPSKDAILGALLERRFEELLAQFQAVLEASRSASLDMAIRSAITGLVHYNHTVDARLHAPLIESMVPTGRYAQYRAYIQRFAEILAQYFESRRTELRVSDCTMVAFMLVSCADGIAQGLAYRTSEPGDEQRLIDAACDLVCQYLLPRSE